MRNRPGPLYRAIAEAVAEDLKGGRLAPGTRLPTHRALAEELGVTVGTVSRAYAEAARRGLISGEVGRGTFVRGQERGAPLPVAEGGEAGLIDLSVNHPPLSSVETQALRATLAAISSRADVSDLITYQPDAGALRHRDAGAAWIRRFRLEARPEQVLVCSGAQHAMALLFTALLKPGDILLSESLTYPGMKTLASLLNLRLEPLAMDEHGLRPDAFEAACRSGTAKALYCLPTIQNPTSAVMPEERRREVAAIARASGVAIVEDDIHGTLAPDAPKPLSAFAPEISYYITSTAKTMAPGLRIAYLLAPPGMVERLAASLRATTWMAPPLSAEIASTWIGDGTADAILESKRQEAFARQALARAALGSCEYRAHPYAFHLWLSLPEPWRSATFAAQALRRGVAVAPAEVFLVGRESAPHAVRVSLGAARSRGDLQKALGTLMETLEGPEDAGIAIV